MAYGKIKADTLVYDGGGSDTEIALSQLANKADSANPTFTGTVIVPTVNANDNTTKAASTAYVQTELGDYLTTATATSTYAPKASPTFTGTPTVPGYATLASPTFTGTVNAAALTLSGDLTVQGTTTTISSTTIDVADKNIELGKVSSPSDTTADGGGITLKGATDKTFQWTNSIDAWSSSEHIKLSDNKKLYVGASEDLQIYHDGSHSYIKESGTGALKLDGDDIRLTNAAGNNIVKVNGTVAELFHTGNKKLETTADGVTVTGTVSDTKGDVRKIPLNLQSSAYTLVAADASKHIRTSANVTIPNSVFTAGDAVTIINQHSGDITLTQGSGVTLWNAANGTSGNRTLATRGMATLIWTTASIAYISGAGLS